MRRVPRALPALLAAAALGGCGGDEEQPAGRPAPAGTELAVEVTGAASRPVRMTLRCGGRCDTKALERALTPEPGRACTLQYGGPEKAHVTGTLEGRAVDVVLDREDGCGIAAYEALFAAFGRRPPLAG